MEVNYKRGVNFAVITAIISGFSIFLNKYAVGIITPPLLFTTTKNLGVALIVTSILIYRKKLFKLKTLTTKELKMLLAIALIGGTIPFYLFFTGLTQTSAINAAFLQKTLVIWVAILAIPFLKEKMSREQFFAVALIFASNFVVGGFKGFVFNKGELMILGSSVFWAIEYMIARKVLATVDSDIVVFFRMAVGSVLLLIAALIIPAKNTVKTDLSSMLWLAASVGLLFFYVQNWYKALKFAPAIAVSSILVGSTLITNVLSALFVTHTMTPQIVLQTAMILAGTAVFYKAKVKTVAPAIVEA